VDTKIDVQLKCTSDRAHVHDTFISWQLDRDHYDKLRAKAANPKLLVVLTIPDDFDSTIEHSVNQLVLRNCVYWVKMTGMEPVATASKTVRLPKENLFSPAQLRTIMERLCLEEDL
jgi:hypothetical protein